MNAPRYAVAAARLLSRHLPGGKSTEPDRDRSLDTIQRGMRARSRRRWLTLGGGTLLAVGAAAAFAMLTHGAGHRAESPDVSINVATAKGVAVSSSGAPQRVSGALELLAGQRLETPVDGGATLRLSTGTAMVLAGSTSFRVDSQGRDERFSLERGELSARVAKLQPGQRFIVETPDAEVEVRGTRFRLRVIDRAESCGGGSLTRLEVTEGVVEVRAGQKNERVTAGERWPRDCLASLPPERGHAPPGPNSASPPAPRAVGPHRITAPSAPRTVASADASTFERGSALSLQNDLFARGVALRRQGDVTGALRAYADLLRQFPTSPLAENALAERLRLLAAQGDPRAANEADRYLARYPHGFAAEEARRVAGRP